MKKSSILIVCVMAFILASCSVQKSLVVLTTNDTHSQILPGDDGTGGYARRLGIIDTVRANHKCVVLVDDGDFSQGTIFFNFFKGDVEVLGMNTMKYDAVTLGNHEFDNGLDSLAKHLSKAKFPIVCANYDVKGTALEGLVKPYVIIKRDGLKIGIFGLGISPVNLIADYNFKGITWLNPEETASAVAEKLKKQEKCDVVICISHLGVAENAKFSDWTIAKNSHYIDLICSGHSHLVINKQVPNADGKPVQIIQAGKTGAQIGRVDMVFRK
ncbi:bifunctional metallophosphatase/5'-nucleotidase [Paludibacter jiangxiensis]|nr:bifunctional UDP-sugar hydrolase/5'-nucleotidase [Paludibacter jiangxiensis]